MNWWKRAFENVLWKSRLIVVLGVLPSIIAGVALFCIDTVAFVRVLTELLHYLNPALPIDQKETLFKQSIVQMIAAIDAYLLGAFMLIFGFGLYELFLADLETARTSLTAGRILRIKSLDDLKTRLAKVILIILIVEIFKDAYGIKAETPLDLLYIGSTIALIGLALYLTHSSGPAKGEEQAALDKNRDEPSAD